MGGDGSRRVGGPQPSAALAAVIAIVALLGGCSSEGQGSPTLTPSPGPSTAVPSPATTGGTGGGPVDGGSLRFALSNDPAAIDPRFLSDEAGTFVADALFDSLVALNDREQVVPAVASSWEVEEDATLFTFTLRRDAVFHDGRPVTAADFERAFDRIADGTAEPPSFVAYQLAPVAGFDEAQASGGGLSGVEAVDDHTLRIRLRRPFAEFLEVLTHPSLAPVPPQADEDLRGFGQEPVGNGPFRMAEAWQHNQFIRLGRFDGHRSPPRLDEVLFQIYADDPAQRLQYAAFEQGQLHVAEVPPSELLTAIATYGEAEDGLRAPGVLNGPQLTIYYYGFNTAAPPFDSLAVRRAFTQLVDRDRIAFSIMRGTRSPLRSIVPPGVNGHQPDACPWCEFDPDAARQTLAEAGIDPASIGPVSLLHNTGETHETIAEAVAEDIQDAIGVEVTIQGLDLQEFVDTLRGGEVQMFRLGWPADYPSMGAFLYPLFHSSRMGTDNLSRYADPEVDALLDEARAELDPNVRRERYQEVERRLLDAAVIAPVFAYEANRVVADEVEGFVLSPLGRVDLARVSLRSPS